MRPTIGSLLPSVLHLRFGRFAAVRKNQLSEVAADESRLFGTGILSDLS